MTGISQEVGNFSEQVWGISMSVVRGADHIGYKVGLAASTVQSILNRAGLGRLDRGDRATDPKPVQRYQRDSPGELIHVDIKKLGAIPDGGRWRIHGKGNDGHHGRGGYRWRYIHTAIDDRTRIAYSEILDNERAFTAAGFWKRAAAWYASIGITCERVITDNGSCYRSGSGIVPVPKPEPPSKRLAHTGPRPTGR